MQDSTIYTAFEGVREIARGELAPVLTTLKRRFDEDPHALVLVFEERTGKQVDFDLRGSAEAVLQRAAPPVRSGPGRPKLGVVAREVSLLPRHWEWLEEQSGGASAAIRRLVEEARRREPEEQKARRAREAAGRFMTAMAGDLAGYEEATRALYAGNREKLREMTGGWPEDVRRRALEMAGGGE
jgi:hypothetical protein